MYWLVSNALLPPQARVFRPVARAGKRLLSEEFAALQDAAPGRCGDGFFHNDAPWQARQIEPGRVITERNDLVAQRAPARKQRAQRGCEHRALDFGAQRVDVAGRRRIAARVEQATHGFIGR